MANFVILVDPDPQRRAAFVKTVEPIISPIDGLRVTSCASGDLCAVWAASPRAPVSYIADQEGCAIVWGEAITGSAFERVSAPRLRTLWDNPTRTPDVFDGFYAAVVYRTDAEMAVGADVLGLFPVYYWTASQVLLVGSSPELFRYHETFRVDLDPEGLVGILLTMHLLDGRTLLRGVRRLAPGRMLVWHPTRGVSEVDHYTLPLSRRYYHLHFSAHVDLLDRYLDQAVSRHCPPGRAYGLLLSGGRDSRMLGGYLRRKHLDVAALTMGVPTDYDMQAAAGVARTLGFRHRTADVPTSQYARCAALQVKWEHGANGYNNITTWGSASYLEDLPSYLVTGFVADAIAGGSHIVWAYSPATRSMSFDNFFLRINAWGLSPDRLTALLRRNVFGDLVHETIGRMRSMYEGYGELESERAWCFDLHHRQRLHVGGELWRLSFGAWPVLPVVDQGVLEVTSAVPAATLAERRLQDELLVDRFPVLSELPFDRYFPSARRIRASLLLRRTAAWARRYCLSLKDSLSTQKPNRYYWQRIYDINSPGWKAVRSEAEALREIAYAYFDRATLDELLPSPDTRITCKHWVEASGLKSLIGFMLWARDHLK